MHDYLPTERVEWLANRIRAGDSQAEDELVRTFRRRILLLAAHDLHDPDAAEDVVQETLMAVIKALRGGQLHDATKLPAFVYGTARNLIRNFLRQRGHHPEPQQLTDGIAAVAEASPEEAEDRQALVRAALENLEEGDRTILLLTLVDGLKPREIAEALKLSPETVRSRKSRALKKVTEEVQNLSRIPRGGNK